MSLQLALAIASVGLQVKASRDASRAARAEGDLQKRNIEANLKALELKTLQEHNSRMEQIKLFKSANNALLGKSGRAKDRSVDAIIRTAEKRLRRLSGRASTQALAQAADLSLKSTLVDLQVKNAQRAYKYQALGAIIGGASKAQGLIPNQTYSPNYSYQYKGLD